MAIIISVLLFTLCMLLNASAHRYEHYCPVIGMPGKYSYDPSTGVGPSDWGDIAGYETCEDGTSQSPIDISSYRRTKDPPPFVSAATSKYVLKSSTENWSLDCKRPGTCGYARFERVKYNVVNLHFHAPSEHTINGSPFALESHIVHMSDDDKILVIATLYSVCKRDHPNPLLEQVLNGICRGADKFRVCPQLALVKSRGFYIYSGSLTTPPCSEGVTFSVQRKISCVTQKQLDKYIITSGATSSGNNRPVQPLNGRTVRLYT